MTIRTLLLTIVGFITGTYTFGQMELPSGVSREWYERQTTQLTLHAYKISPAEKPYEFKTKSNSEQLSVVINNTGYKVSNNAITATGNWEANFRIKKIGGYFINGNPGNYTDIQETSSSLLYKGSRFNIQYINNKDGLRQNFIVHKKPTACKNLQIEIAVATALHATVKNNSSLVLSANNDSGGVKLIYDQLKVWDNNGKTLPAVMLFDEKENILCIDVDDRNAVYPVTVDPLNRVPEWTSSADGILPGLLTNLQLQVQSAYGYTVAGLGDINGDGFDDVAIGAPSMADVVTGSGSLAGVGAVFIYLGAATGLPATPSKVLQPTTPVAGALFGMSIAAGDITGDGKNDIIIGAPMDSYQTNAASLLGSTSVTVKAGKVYVYRSEDLFTAPVPSPFLQLRLDGTAWFSTGIAGLLLSNVSVNQLFGYSVATTKDCNGDGKDDIVIGCPAYLGTNLTSVQSGACFVYYSNNLGTSSPVKLSAPSSSLLGLPTLPLANTSGLLFGFSVDGAGDYNNDGNMDIVVGAPAGINLNSLGGIFTGQFLGGSGYVFYGTGSGIQSSSAVRLQASPSGLLSNAANLFGYKVKGAKNAAGANTGNILAGAPTAAVISNAGGLVLKAGEVHVFKSRAPGTSGAFSADQVLSSPRSSSVLGILSGQTLTASLLYGASIDNMLDVNCDNIGDIIIGEPLSSAVPVIGANITGGAAWVYLGKADGTYDAVNYWNLTSTVSPLLGVNATSLVGFSVAGAGYTKGHSEGVRAIAGAPSNTLDFGGGLLNLGNTLSTTYNFAFDNNGLGKAYGFGFTNCTLSLLPVKITDFTAQPKANTVLLNWNAANESNLHYYSLEKSDDGVHFQQLAMVFAKDAQMADYNFTDKHPYGSWNYYRLKMIDNDGSFTYSTVLSILLKQAATGSIQVAPNPVQASINLQLKDLPKGAYRLQLHSTAGQVFLNQTVNVTGNSGFTSIPRNNLPAGMYWLSITDNKNIRVGSIKIVLQ